MDLSGSEPLNSVRDENVTLRARLNDTRTVYLPSPLQLFRTNVFDEMNMF